MHAAAAVQDMAATKTNMVEKQNCIEQGKRETAKAKWKMKYDGIEENERKAKKKSEQNASKWQDWWLHSAYTDIDSIVIIMIIMGLCIARTPKGP